MKIIEAIKIVHPWCSRESPHLQHPYVQDLNGRFCMVGVSAAAAIWVALSEPAWLGRYTEGGGPAPLDPDLPRAPDLTNAIPPPLWGVDMTEAMIEAVALARTVPVSELRAKRAADRAVVGITPNGSVVLHRRKIADGPPVPLKLAINAQFLDRMPDVTRATQYRGDHGPIVMTHGPDCGSIVMPVRGLG